MSTIMVSIEGVSVKRHTGKPRLLVRGRRRAALVHLLRALATLENQDWAEARRASSNNYSPYSILGATNSVVYKALQKLRDRCKEALAARA